MLKSGVSSRQSDYDYDKASIRRALQGDALSMTIIMKEDSGRKTYKDMKKELLSDK